MDDASYNLHVDLQLAAAKAEQDMFNKMNPGFWDFLKALPKAAPFVPEVGKVYRDKFVNTREKSTVLCITKKEKPGSLQFLELRRGDLTGKKLDAKLFDSWEEYQDYLFEYEPACDYSDDCKCEDCRYWNQRRAREEEEEEDYTND